MRVEGPAVTMCVEVAEDDGGGGFVQVVLEEVAEAMATVWDFVVNVDETKGDSVVRDVKYHGVEVGDGVVGVEFDLWC